jgi:DNA-binding CsgD family transcriptional regulator
MLAPDSLQRWHQSLAQAMAACHGPHFAEALVDALASLVPVESVMINLERIGGAPSLLFERGIPAENRELLLKRYFSRGYLLDPFCLAVAQGLPEGFYSLGEIAPDDFFSSQYYKTYYLGAGSVEDCYFMLELSARERVSLSLYNGLSAAPWQPQQLQLLRSLAPVILELGRQHWRNAGAGMQQQTPDFEQQLREAFMSFGEGKLTARELEVCHLLLRGHSAKSSARCLGIAAETVRMHRKNLYTKLQIGSQAELFSLFIEWLSKGAS